MQQEELMLMRQRIRQTQRQRQRQLARQKFCRERRVLERQYTRKLEKALAGKYPTSQE